MKTCYPDGNPPGTALSLREGLDLRMVGRIVRVEGLLPFTGAGILLGFAVVVWERGSGGADWVLFLVSALAALLIHIDAHLWNDILDAGVDRYEKSQETGRARPLVQGWATVAEYRQISTLVTLTVLALTVFLTRERIWIPGFILMGFLFDYGYNHPRFALGHRPFTEWYLLPWLVVGVTVTVVYAATGLFSLLAFILSLLHGLLVTCFGVSMMRRDVNSDRKGRKFTSSVVYPEVPHSTLYGLVTLVAAVLMLFPLARVLGSMEQAYLLVLITALTAAVTTVYGAGIDQLCTRVLYSVFPEFEGRAQRLMMQQVGLSLVHAMAISLFLLTVGRAG